MKRRSRILGARFFDAGKLDPLVNYVMERGKKRTIYLWIGPGKGRFFKDAIVDRNPCQKIQMAIAHGLRASPVLLWAAATFNPDFRSCDPRKARGAILAQQSRWGSASEPIAISGAAKDVEFHRNDLTNAKMTLKLQSRTPSLLQDCTSLPAGFGLTAESGFKWIASLAAMLT